MKKPFVNKKEPNPTDKHVGSRIRMRRMMLNMSQEKLGEALGLTFQQVQKYEKGTNRVGASRLEAISVILKVPVSFFFEGLTSGGKSAEKNPQDVVSVQEFIATRDGLEMCQLMMKIKSTPIKHRIVELVRGIVEAQ